MEIKRPAVSPYAPVLEKKEQMRLDMRKPIQSVLQKPVIQRPAQEKPVSAPQTEPFLLKDSQSVDKPPVFTEFLENVLESEPQPVAPQPTPIPAEERLPLSEV